MQLKDLRGHFFPPLAIQHDEQLKHIKRPTNLFAATVIFYILHQLAMQPNWVLGGEMWAEMATNYFHNASASSYFQKLFSTDAGYIPLPLRLIALIGHLLDLPAAWIPYFYTWSSILLTGILVGTFCLPQFRKLIKNDLLRFFTAVAILLVADFETRTFINFTYFSAFFIAIITALALIDDSEQVPWWAWFIPLLMLSKPAVLATLPAMILASTVSRSRFRLITLFATLFCIGQIFQLSISSAAGIQPFRSTDITLISKLLAAVTYFLGLLGGYTTGPYIKLPPFLMVSAGALVLSICIYLLAIKRSATNALILTGLSLLLFNTLLNTFALSDSWNLDLNKLHRIRIYRHVIVGFFGYILIASSIACHLVNNNSHHSRLHFIRKSGTSIFAAWFLTTGWLLFAYKMSREPASPTLNSSQWQTMASAIDANQSPLCVPLNPWWKSANWMYQRDCYFLAPPPDWEDGLLLAKENLPYQIIPPTTLSDKILVSAAVLVKPHESGKPLIEAVMRINMKNGDTVRLSGSGKINSRGGLLMLIGEESISINEIKTISLTFNTPVEVALAAQEPIDVPSITWMGH